MMYLDILVEKFNNKIPNWRKYIINNASKTFTISNNKIKKTKKIKIWMTNGLLTSINNRQKIKVPFDLKLKQHYIRHRNLLNL